MAVLLSAVLLIMDLQGNRLAKARSALSFVVYPILSGVNLPFEFFSDLSSSASNFLDLKEENKRLKEQLFISDTKMLKYAALEKENIRLRSLLQSSYNIGEQVLVAEIMSVNFVPFDHVVQVNKGSRFGLHARQAVLDPHGVVGQVVRALPLTSEVMLITDPNHAIPVQINRNGLRTIAVGTGQLNRLVLPFLPNKSDVQKGDLLVTSGLGGTFPQGYPVAVVDNIETQPNRLFPMVSATPKAALDKIREVLIVWSDSKSMPMQGNSMLDTPAATTNSPQVPVVSPDLTSKKQNTTIKKSSGRVEDINVDLLPPKVGIPSAQDSKAEDVSTESAAVTERPNDSTEEE